MTSVKKHLQYCINKITLGQEVIFHTVIYRSTKMTAKHYKSVIMFEVSVRYISFSCLWPATNQPRNIALSLCLTE